MAAEGTAGDGDDVRSLSPFPLLLPVLNSPRAFTWISDRTSLLCGGDRGMRKAIGPWSLVLGAATPRCSWRWRAHIAVAHHTYTTPLFQIFCPPLKRHHHVPRRCSPPCSRRCRQCQLLCLPRKQVLPPCKFPPHNSTAKDGGSVFGGVDTFQAFSDVRIPRPRPYPRRSAWYNAPLYLQVGL